MKATKTTIGPVFGTFLLSAASACSAAPGTDDSTESHWLEGTAKTHAGSEASSNDENAENVEEPSLAPLAVDAEPDTTPEVEVTPEQPPSFSDTPSVAKSIQDMDAFWIRQWGGVHTETVDELGADSAGNVVVIGHVEVGTDEEGAEDRAQYIVKLDAAGEQLWRIETPDRREIDIPQNLAVSANGHAFVAASVGDDNIDASVTHYDADGNVVWTSTWGDEAAGDGVYDVALDSQANVFVAGDVWKDELSHAVVTKLDAQGNVVWTQQFDSVQDENASEVAVDSSGNVLLALRLGYKVGAIDSVVRKLDSEGNILWNQTWEGPEDTFIFGLATDWHGNVFIAGSQEDDVESGFVAKLDCQGTVSWFERSSSWGLNVVTSLAVAPAGVVAASMGWSSGSIALTRLDTSGTLLWSDTFGTPETDRVYSLAVTTDQIVLAGETYGALDGINAGNSDSYVLALNPAH